MVWWARGFWCNTCLHGREQTRERESLVNGIFFRIENVNKHSDLAEWFRFVRRRYYSLLYAARVWLDPESPNARAYASLTRAPLKGNNPSNKSIFSTQLYFGL